MDMSSELEQQIREMRNQGFSIREIARQTGVPRSSVHRQLQRTGTAASRQRCEIASTPPEKGDARTMARADRGEKHKSSNSRSQGMKETPNVSEASYIELVAMKHTIPLTPDIYIGYMCALKRGFSNDLTAWLSIASRNFWESRGVNPYKEVGG